MSIKIYTDGSCCPNPGMGGWGLIAIFPDGNEIHLNRGEKMTTNNIMEMTAVIEALKLFPDEKKLYIVSDSQYVINCAQGKWRRKKNVELWLEYDKYAKGKDIIWEWVRGHTGDHYNELVDKLAKSAVPKKIFKKISKILT